jgi:hypothetical protein
MYETFGAGRQPDGTYGFRLFVPDKTVDPQQYVRGGDCKIVEVRVVGDFQDRIDPGRNNWDYGDGLVMAEQAHPHGRLFAYTLPPQFPDGYYQYKYVVKFQNGSVRWVGDPCTKYGGTRRTTRHSSRAARPSRPSPSPSGCPGRTWSSTS